MFLFGTETYPLNLMRLVPPKGKVEKHSEIGVYDLFISVTFFTTGSLQVQSYFQALIVTAKFVLYDNDNNEPTEIGGG